ncbi:Ankyrin-3 like protein [Argiope bruennichi]|uniref:Ankyrin-3 like protein n=1 Tax=Argiope bruennichi TaxID=94029 RepID=A0A8T0EK07_ARGBR|nr:Ankyrin-3 like protein [Argiope bruennichi]
MMDYIERLLPRLVETDNNIEVVRKILAKGNYKNLTDSSGGTLLHIAAKSVYDNPEIVQELINTGADVCRLDHNLSTPLHFAVICGKRKVVDVLLQTEIPINQKNYLGITALHYAINKNINPIFSICGVGADIYIVRKLLDHRLINVDATDSYQQTPLIWAIKNNHLEIVKMLLNKNASVDTSDFFRQTPLHHALFHRDHRIVVALLLKKASLLKMAGDGNTPLNIIIKSQWIEFVCSCLKLVKTDDNLEEIQKLLNGGADPNFRIYFGRTPIHEAAGSNQENTEVVEELIRYGADVNFYDDFGYTALHYAVIQQKFYVVEALLQAGAFINAKTFQGETPLHLAVSAIKYAPEFQKPDTSVIESLLDHEGVDCNTKDCNGNTPLMLAVKGKSSLAVELLLIKKQARI